MKTEELRAGNYVKADQVTVKITSILENRVLGIAYPKITPNYLGKELEYKVSIDNKNVPELKPIPLSEEILLKNPDIFSINSAAFVNAGELPPEEIIYYIDNIKLTRIGVNAWKAEYWVNDILNDPSVLFVHELQNLYQSVTGNYLDLNIE